MSTSNAARRLHGGIRLAALLLCVLSAVLAHPGGLDLPAPGCVVRGEVVDDESGQPLPSARGSLFVARPGVPAGARLRPDDTAETSFHADAEGRFSIPVAAEFADGGQAHLLVQAPGHAEWRPIYDESSRRLAAVTLKKGQPADIPVRMKRGRTLAGTVTGPDGGPVSGAKVELTLAGPNWCSWPQSMSFGQGHHWPAECVSDATGHWEMLGFPWEEAKKQPGARFVITVDHPRYAKGWVQSVEAISAPGGIVTIHSSLKQGLVLVGSVVDDEGHPVASATISAEGQKRADEPVCLVYERSATSDATGRFELTGLDGRSFEVRARSPLHAPVILPWISLAGGPPADSLRVVLHPGADLKGRVVRKDGTPEAGLELRLSLPGARFADTVETRSDGSFSFTGLPRGKGSVAASQLFERSVSIPTDPIEIRLENLRELVVRLVRDEDGTSLRPPGGIGFYGPGFSSWRALESSDGRVSLGPLAPGEYRVKPDIGDRACRMMSIRHEGGSGADEVLVRVPRGFNLKGTVSDGEGHPVADARVEAFGRSDHRETTTGRDGRYEIPGLDGAQTFAGSWYLIVATGDEFATKPQAQVYFRFSPFARTLDFKLQRGCVVRGRVSNPDGTPASGLLVKAMPPKWYGVKRGWAPYPVPSSVTGPDGGFRLEHVLSGDVVLAVGAETKGYRVADGAEQLVEWTLRR